MKQSIPCPHLFRFTWCCIIFLCAWTTAAHAQCNNIRQVLDQAESFYAIGQFYLAIEQVDPILSNECMEKKDKEVAPELKRRTYEILAKNFIALDSLVEADKSISKLLQLYPLYEIPTNAPNVYKQRVQNIRYEQMSSSVSSVSKKMEDIFQTPATVIVITQEQIRRRGYIDLDQLFDDLPGFDVSRTVGASTYSNLYQRGYRSSNTDRTIFMIDGIEDNDFWSNKSYWGRQIPISNVDRVEVIYGPASTMYGPNALIGVVNVITRQPSGLVKDNYGLGVRADAGYGSFDTKYGDLTLGAKLSPKNDVFLSVTGRYYQSNEMDFSRFREFDYNPDDYDQVDYNEKLGVNSLSNEDVDKYWLLLDYVETPDSGYYQLSDYTVSELAALDKSALDQPLNGQPIGYSNLLEQYYVLSRLQAGGFTLGYQYWNTRMGNNNYGTDNAVPGYENGGFGTTSQSTLFARFTHNLSSKLNLLNTAQFRVNEVDANAVGLYNYSNGRLGLNDLNVIGESFEPTLPGWYAENLFQRSRQFRNELQLFYSPDRHLDVVGGLEYRYSNNQTDYLKTVDSTLTTYYKPASGLDLPEENQQIDVQNLGAYLQGTYSVTDGDQYEWLHITLGGRYDLTRYGIDSDLINEFSPRIAVVYTPKFGTQNGDGPKQNVYLKGIYARAFQLPTSWDRYATFDGRLLNNPNLEPEIVNNVELVAGYNQFQKIRAEISGYSATYSKVVSQQEVCVQLNEAGNRYELIDRAYCGENTNYISTTQNQNIDQLTIYGLQATFSYQVNEQWNFYANYSYANPKDSLNRRVSDIASHRFNAGGNWSTREGKLSTHLRMNYVGARPTGEGTTVPSNPQVNDSGKFQFDPYIVFNGTVTLHMGKFFQSLENMQIQGIVNNILNTEYFHPGIRSANGVTNAYRLPQRERNFMIRLIYDFK